MVGSVDSSSTTRMTSKRPSAARSPDARTSASPSSIAFAALLRPPDSWMAPTSTGSIRVRSGEPGVSRSMPRRNRLAAADWSPRARARSPAENSRPAARVAIPAERSSAAPSSTRYRTACSRWYPTISSNSDARSAATPSSQAAKRSWSSARCSFDIES